MSEITPNTPNPVREDAYVEELSEKLGIDPQYIPKSPVWRNEEEIKAIAEMFANMSGGGSLPTDPAQDGTYNLQNTVSSGTGTLSWASGGSSGGGVLVVHGTGADSTATYDKTWKEINDSEVPVFIRQYSQGQYFWDAVSMTYEIEGSYQIATFSGETVETDSENGNVFVPVG